MGKVKSFAEYLDGIGEKGFLLLDGASGTELTKRGLPGGVCPEAYLLDKPGILEDMQRDYYENGSDVIYTYTFGGNYSKLSQYSFNREKIFNMNKELATISCEIRDEFRLAHPNRFFFVAGDIAPTGKFLSPAGDMGFEEMVEIYRDQARALEEGGVDLFVVETMMDLLQAKAAIIGIKEVSNLPIFASLTFEEGKTLSGNTPEACAVALVPLGVKGLGANCGSGPDELVDVISRFNQVTNLPIIAKPNAGMPTEIDGQTIFPMKAPEFSASLLRLHREGASILGGCCGSDPSYIGRLKEDLENPDLLEGQEMVKEMVKEMTFLRKDYVSSYNQIQIFSQDKLRKINITLGDDLIDLALDAQEKFEAEVLSRNIDRYGDGPRNENEEKVSNQTILGAGSIIVFDFTPVDQGLLIEDLEVFINDFAVLSMTFPLPLGVKTSSPYLLEQFARSYPGRLLFLPDTQELETGSSNEGRLYKPETDLPNLNRGLKDPDKISPEPKGDSIKPEAGILGPESDWEHIIGRYGIKVV